MSALKDTGAKSVVDLGCGEGNLLRLLLAETQFETILGMDVSWRSLETTKERLRLDELPEHQWGRIELIQGSLTYRRDVLLQLAMPLCLVDAVRNKVRTFSVEDKTGAYSLTTPSGEEHQFTRIVDVARWATANAFG